MDTVKIDASEIQVGKALTWAVYDERGRLLLQKGELISSERQLGVLFEKGLYRSLKDTPDTSSRVKARPTGKQNPFRQIQALTERAAIVFAAISHAGSETQSRLFDLCDDIQDLCEKDSDAVLGAIHLAHETRPGYVHIGRQIHMAILVEVVTRRLGMDATTRRSVDAAALSCNVGMANIAEALLNQTGKLSDEQKAVIQDHPQLGVSMLQKAGISDPAWLACVAQHHERLDGTGYPLGLKGEAILREAKVITLAEVYAAMVSPRSYRDSMEAKDALRELFMQRSVQIDEQLATAFIKELGIYPPGSFVTLASGETGIVVQRAKDNTAPTVLAVLSPRGGPYERPMPRDCRVEMYKIKSARVKEATMAYPYARLWGFDE